MQPPGTHNFHSQHRPPHALVPQSTEEALQNEGPQTTPLQNTTPVVQSHLFGMEGPTPVLSKEKSRITEKQAFPESVVFNTCFHIKNATFPVKSQWRRLVIFVGTESEMLQFNSLGFSTRLSQKASGDMSETHPTLRDQQHPQDPS